MTAGPLPDDATLVYVPAGPTTDRRDVALEIHHLEGDGAPVGLAFTTVDRLVSALGDHQPWARLPMLNYTALLVAHGVGRVQVDPEPPPGVRQWDLQRLRSYLEEPR